MNAETKSICIEVNALGRGSRQPVGTSRVQHSVVFPHFTVTQVQHLVVFPHFTVTQVQHLVVFPHFTVTQVQHLVVFLHLTVALGWNLGTRQEGNIQRPLPIPGNQAGGEHPETLYPPQGTREEGRKHRPQPATGAPGPWAPGTSGGRRSGTRLSGQTRAPTLKHTPTGPNLTIPAASNGLWPW